MAQHEVQEGDGKNRVRGKKGPHIGPKLPLTEEELFKGKRLFVVLEMASLETAKTKHGYELLNAEDHHSLLIKHNRDVDMYRPDILHHALLTLLDSPLNKAGLLKIFIHTTKNVLIDVNPKLRLPRTYKRFAGLMVQLLYQFRIRALKSSEKLLKIIKNPIVKHLPPGAPIIGTSSKADLVDIFQFVSSLPKDEPIVFVFGSHPKGPVLADYTEQSISISQYPLSSSAAISRVLGAFEKQWDVL